jgi:hypothetical protein
MIRSPEPLRFPRGVRLAVEGDLPRSKNRPEQLAKLASAKISTGFVLTTGNDPGFSAYFEANIHADEVWRVFEALVERLLPEVAAPLVGWKDEDATVGPYTDRTAAMAALRPYVDSLQHDGYIQFGLMHQRAGKTEEVFVKSSKYMQIWTNQPEVAAQILVSMKIQKVEKLQFIDEFPVVTERLPGDPSSLETITKIVTAFAALPTR